MQFEYKLQLSLQSDQFLAIFEYYNNYMKFNLFYYYKIELIHNSPNM